MKNILLPLAALFVVFQVSPAFTDASTSTSTTKVVENGKTDDGYNDDATTSQTEIKHLQVNSGQDQAPVVVQQPGVAERAPVMPAPAARDSYNETVITEKQPSTGGLRNEAVGINPQFGILTLTDANGSTDSRGVAGLTIDINGLRRVNTEGGRPFFGPSLGILYSHLGSLNSDFFGLNGANGNSNGGTHLLLMPFDLKAGYTISDVFRPSVHAGGTLIYNNTQDAATGVEVNNSSTTVRANVGLDFEFGIGRSVALMLRPDWVFASNSTIFTGTLGLVFPIS